MAAVALFTVAVVASSERRRAQAAGRAVALARDVTASWPVRIKSADYLTIHGPGMDAGWVSLRGEFIAVTALPVARVVNGREFSFPAREAAPPVTAPPPRTGGTR